ncbi:hypothetical protein M8818_002367 [Zalaria obscura]|uniref:Uncharacterized protein n=1 Tax=Zalaria obscura TaxID=2024903 RepID=A0ACC3SII0_9PEZI
MGNHQSRSIQAALAHLGERQTEVKLRFLAFCAVSGGTVFDPQKLHFLHFQSALFCSVLAKCVVCLELACCECMLRCMQSG